MTPPARAPVVPGCERPRQEQTPRPISGAEVDGHAPLAGCAHRPHPLERLGECRGARSGDSGRCPGQPFPPAVDEHLARTGLIRPRERELQHQTVAAPRQPHGGVDGSAAKLRQVRPRVRRLYRRGWWQRRSGGPVARRVPEADHAARELGGRRHELRIAPLRIVEALHRGRLAVRIEQRPAEIHRGAREVRAAGRLAVEDERHRLESLGRRLEVPFGDERHPHLEVVGRTRGLGLAGGAGRRGGRGSRAAQAGRAGENERENPGAGEAAGRRHRFGTVATGPAEEALRPRGRPPGSPGRRGRW